MQVKKRAGIGTLCIICAVAAVLGGCRSSDRQKVTEEGTKNAFQGEYIISAEDALKKAGDSEVLFLDARGSKKAFLGTVKGAAATDWQALSTCDEGKAGDEAWGLVPEEAELARRLGSLGIQKDTEIIVLGQPEDGWGEDGRVLWELRQAGCTNVKMVDGGISAMKDLGLSTVLGASKPEKAEMEIESLNKSHDISTEELQKNYEDYKIVDARTKEEYDGAVLYDEAKGGHLPGAVHLAYTELFRENGTLKSNEELTRLFEKKGLEKEDKIVTYCTGGIRSAYMQLVMEMCGYQTTYSYGQSYWRWAVVGDVE
ncbi:rhodanese-like domain-containing protein [Bariatricus massiliensis]|uniref:thiosulfate sulfurtransferase n=1 Tax=Bariatricus massiliensis TaxID=1745713 RepID=A0ABS8DK36_9FIRM|nr:rhodanese-like domain-containing protein [Bariatricus massiliensis]MCB7305597.1 sulfurtransferase [Bariatricus massiliensis]MCB7376151.1 sulfurtransferase [Bariatricus massiliensis]MCB7388735.1 sulfurtransferase [Bariatricus massiliensis]MCB7412908.1 sulfurtransferase [Bariatricus massiliensis]MCQ5253214.1 rhodanese-like domain-containing protein [Bariatricus massiliensis]